MSASRAFVPDLSMFGPGAEMTLEGDDAHHLVRVKRAQAGDEVVLLDGRGRVAASSIVRTGKQGRDGWLVTVRLAGVEIKEKVKPEIQVWTAAPKGDRLHAMIDGLSQVGAASWAPMVTARTVVEPSEGKIERLHRVAMESAKQCGRAWMLEIDVGGEFRDALAPGMSVVVADGSGEEYEAKGDVGDGPVRVLIGPEGGLAPEELERARASGARVCRFGPHVMRIETAAQAVVARILAAHGV